MRILGILLVLLLSSCALTYDVTPHKCELMQRGQIITIGGGRQDQHILIMLL